MWPAVANIYFGRPSWMWADQCLRAKIRRGHFLWISHEMIENSMREGRGSEREPANERATGIRRLNRNRPHQVWTPTRDTTSWTRVHNALYQSNWTFFQKSEAAVEILMVRCYDSTTPFKKILHFGGIRAPFWATTPANRTHRVAKRFNTARNASIRGEN